MLKKKLFITCLATIMIMTFMIVMSINVFAEVNLYSQKVAEETIFKIKDTKDLAILSEELDRFIIKNPKSTEQEQEQHLITFIKNGGLNQVSLRRAANYFQGYNNLNSAERELALAHPVQAIKVYNDGNTATSKTIEIYGENGWKDNSDAFRHCLWNALMKKSIGVVAAEQWATAHEHDSSGVDKDMDMHNNKIGRSIDVSNKSLNSIVDSVKSKVKDGHCRRIVNGSLVATNGDGM